MDPIAPLEAKLLFAMTLDVGYARARHVGDPRGGGRSVFPVDGGTFEGPRLRGMVEGGGADWVTWRADGSMLIDVRLVLATDDGAAIGMTYAGLIHGDAAAMTRFRKGATIGPDDISIRTTPRFETGDARYLWLNTVIAVARGMRTDAGPVYHVFAV